MRPTTKQLQTMSTDEVYLGDGLYASFDGYQFTLRAPRAEGDHYVALEPLVMDKFMAYVKKTTDAIQN
jgi:hypothetical protein